MEIKRDNFRFNRLLNVDDIIGESNLFWMSQDDIDADGVVGGEQLEDGDSIIVFQNTVEPHQNERYCYIKFNTAIGADGHTKQITIDKIIVDNNLINQHLFIRIFNIFLQQEDNDYSNRIIVTNRYNKTFRGRIVETANEIANNVLELYSVFLAQNTNYIIP